MRKSATVTVFVLTTLWAWGVARAEEKVATVVAVRGEVSVSRAGVTLEKSLKVMDELYLHDRISTPAGGRLKLLLTDDSVVTLDENTTLELSDYVYSSQKSIRRGVFTVILGAIRAQLNRSGFAEEEFLVRTQNAIAGVKGTDFVVKALDGEVTKVFVLEGTVEVKNIFLPAVVRSLKAGEFTEVVKRKAPAPPEVMAEPVMNELKRRFSLRAEATRETRDLPRSAAAARGRVPGLEARIESGSASGMEPGGGGVSTEFYNPQVSGQIGLEPPKAGSVVLTTGGGEASPSSPSSPSGSGGGEPFPRKALEEVFGGGRVR